MTTLEHFMDAIRPYMDGWKTIDVRAVAITLHGTWAGLAIRATLTSAQLSSPVQPTIELPDFTAVHERHGIESLAELLHTLETGVLRFGGRAISYGRIEQNCLVPTPPDFYFQMNRRSDPWVQGDLSFPTALLEIRGEQIHRLLQDRPEALDWRLRALDTPYDGLDDLLVGFVGLSKPSWGRTTETAVIQVVAPIQVRLGEGCQLSRGKLNIEVEAIGYESIDDVSVSMIAAGRTAGLQRVSVGFNRGDWQGHGTSRVAYRQLDLGDTTSATLFLRFRQNALDATTVADPAGLLDNPRIAACSHFDRDLNRYQLALRGEGRDRSGDFEIAVATLFHFCGFNTGPYGRLPGIQEEIDVVAFVPGRPYIVAAECTVAEIDANEKLSKLSRRSKALRETLPGFSVCPLLVTPLARRDITDLDLAKATAEGIGVLAAEELEELLELAGGRLEPAEMFGHLASLVEGQRALLRAERSGPRSP